MLDDSKAFKAGAFFVCCPQATFVLLAEAEMKAYISLSGVTKSWRGREILRDFSLEIHKGEFVTLLGPSGCGKTTILNLVAGFVTPSTGSVCVGSIEISKPSPKVGMIFQEYAVFPWRTALKNLMLGLNDKKLSREEKERKSMALLKLVGLEGHEHKFPKALSGGMKQRVAIARTLAADAEVILMDEPFGALDSYMRERLQDLVLDIWKKLHKTIIFVTHNIREAIFLGDRVVVLNEQGRVVFDRPTPLTKSRTDSRIIDMEKAIRPLTTYKRPGNQEQNERP